MNAAFQGAFLLLVILSDACGRSPGASTASPPPSRPDRPVSPPPAAAPPITSGPEGARWLVAYPGPFRPVPVLAPAEDGSADLFALVHVAHEVQPEEPTTLTRFGASGELRWDRTYRGVVSATNGTGNITSDRDGSVLLSTVALGLVPTVVRVAADGRSDSEALRSTQPPYFPDELPLVFERLSVFGDAIAVFTFAPSHWRHLLFVPGGGGPETDIYAGTSDPMLAVGDWVVTPAGSMIVEGQVVGSASVNGVELPPDREVLFEVAPSGSVRWVSAFPAGVRNQQLRVLDDGSTAFLATVEQDGEPSPRLATGRIHADGSVEVVRVLPLSAGARTRGIAFSSHGDVALVTAVPEATDACHAEVAIVHAAAAHAVTLDLGFGYCVRAVTMTSDGAFAFAGFFDRRVRFGPTPGDVGEPAETFVAVVAVE